MAHPPKEFSTVNSVIYAILFCNTKCYSEVLIRGNNKVLWGCMSRYCVWMLLKGGGKKMTNEYLPLCMKSIISSPLSWSIYIM